MIYKLRDIASVIRSKNSGPYELTLDVIFRDKDMYRKVMDADIINHSLIAKLYQIPENKVLSLIQFPQAQAIKATIVRPLASGDLGETDVYGAQQHSPLMNLSFEL